LPRPARCLSAGGAISQPKPSANWHRSRFSLSTIAVFNAAMAQAMPRLSTEFIILSYDGTHTPPATVCNCSAESCSADSATADSATVSRYSSAVKGRTGTFRQLGQLFGGRSGGFHLNRIESLLQLFALANALGERLEFPIAGSRSCSRTICPLQIGTYQRLPQIWLNRPPWLRTLCLK
jgi:hypothetical protein